VDFQAFEAFVRRSAETRAYREVARSLGMSAPDVRRRVARVRERIRKELRGLLGGGQGDP
jgi:DNA-directed RNA polymerase specialized sigma24 family protein